MDAPYGILFEILFSGGALAFGAWQLIALRRLKKKDEARDEPEEG